MGSPGGGQRGDLQPEGGKDAEGLESIPNDGASDGELMRRLKEVFDNRASESHGREGEGGEGELRGNPTNRASREL